MRYLTPFEERLVELVHLLAAGTPEEYGFTLHEVKQFLIKKMPKTGSNALESIELDDKIIQEVRNHLES